MRNSSRMKSHAAYIDSFAGTEFAFHIVQHFIGFDVTVDVRYFDCFWMVVEVPWRERTNNKPSHLKGLLIRGWQVECTGEWFKIPSIESVGVEESVPADDVEWVVGHNDTCQLAAVFDKNRRFDIFVF